MCVLRSDHVGSALRLPFAFPPSAAVVGSLLCGSDSLASGFDLSSSVPYRHTTPVPEHTYTCLAVMCCVLVRKRVCRVPDHVGSALHAPLVVPPSAAVVGSLPCGSDSLASGFPVAVGLDVFAPPNTPWPVPHPPGHPTGLSASSTRFGQSWPPAAWQSAHGQFSTHLTWYFQHLPSHCSVIVHRSSANTQGPLIVVKPPTRCGGSIALVGSARLAHFCAHMCPAAFGCTFVAWAHSAGS